MWLNQDMLVSRCSRIDVNTNHHLVHPITNCAVRVVIERIHAAILKSPVGLLTVPAFPDRRCTLLHWIQPRRILLAIQKNVRLIEITITAQHVTDVWSTEKSCGQMFSRPHIFCETFGSHWSQRFGEQLKLQSQHVSRLRIFTNTATLGNKLLLKSIFDVAK